MAYNMLKYFIIVLLVNLSNIDASIRICNDGAFIAKCWLESRSLSFGYRIRYQDTGLFPVAQCRSMEIPIDAFWNRLECKELAFIAVYKSVFVQYFGSSMYNYCYQITGTTLIPRWSQTEC